jgi:hypothetical protein
MPSNVQNALFAAVMKLLRPLVRIFLRNGLPFGAFADLARWVYVDVARREFGIAGRKPSDSRVAIITGLSRKEVRRLRLLDPPTDAAAVKRYNRAARVIAGWRRDPEFAHTDGTARELTLEGAEASFGQLVRRYSGDVPPRAVLDELVQIEAVQIRADDRIRLQADAYLPKGDTEKMYSILGTDVAMLIAAIDHNTDDSSDRPWLQRKVAYDNIPAEALEMIRAYSARAGQHLLEQLDRMFAQYDRDANPKSTGTGRMQAGVGIYYFEGDAPVENLEPDGDDR